MIYRPHVDVLLRGSLNGLAPDVFENFDINVLWDQTLSNLVIPDLVFPNFEMYYSPENGLNTEISIDGTPTTIIAVFIADRGEWYKDIFGMQAQQFLIDDAWQIYGHVNDYVSMIQEYLENVVFAHYRNFLNGVYLELMTEEYEKDVQDIVGGDGKYLEIAETLKSYVGWMSGEMKSWVCAVMEDSATDSPVDIKSWAFPPYPSPDYVPNYYETALYTSNITALVEPLITTSLAANQAFLTTRGNAWADYVKIRTGVSPAGSSFIGLFEAQKESFRQIYETLFWQSLSLTMSKTEIPFGFSVGTTGDAFTSYEHLVETTSATVGTTAIVYAAGGQEFYIVNNSGEWESLATN